jgi:porin
MKYRETITFVVVLIVCLINAGTIFADDATRRPVVSQSSMSPSQRVSLGWVEAPDDPGNQLLQIEHLAARQRGLISLSPIQPLRDGFRTLSDKIYETVHLRLGLSFHTVGQYATNNVQGSPRHGAVSDFDILGTWELFNRGTPTQGEVFFKVEGRWKYGPIGPQDIGFVSLATSGGTANSFSPYYPAFLVRDLYYRMGSVEAGWVFRAGKITPDGMLLTNRHINMNTTFLPNSSTGIFTSAYPDSGFGAAGALYFGDKIYIAGLVSDANADRFTFGDPGEGKFYKAAELGFKLFPRTSGASYSKIMVFHTDGTSSGNAINGNTGRPGWGFGGRFSQELSADGKTILIGSYGRSFNKTAVYDQQASVHLLRYQPFGRFSFEDDVIGAAFNWMDSSVAGSRQEYSFDTFYRFPLFPDLDTTFAYQYVIDPAFTRAFDNAHVFSLRMTTSF